MFSCIKKVKMLPLGRVSGVLTLLPTCSTEDPPTERCSKSGLSHEDEVAQRIVGTRLKLASKAPVLWKVHVGNCSDATVIFQVWIQCSKQIAFPGTSRQIQFHYDVKNCAFAWTKMSKMSELNVKFRRRWLRRNNQISSPHSYPQGLKRVYN